MTRAVAITGLGWIGAAGSGREALETCLRDGGPRTVEVESIRGAHRPGSARSALLVGEFDTARWIRPITARRMGRPARYAVTAAKMALEDAGLPSTLPDPSRSSVVLGTAFGPVLHTERLLRQILHEDPEGAQPALFTECVANAAAAQVAIALNAQGANDTITQSEASPLIALGRAAREVASGRCDLALAGAVEEMTPLLHAILDRFGALARPDEEGRERGRPFDGSRNGFLAGDGATILTLESADAARSRGAPILALVAAWGSAFDPTASAARWGRDAAGLAASLRSGLERHRIDPCSVDRIVSGASGSVGGDALEGRWIRTAWPGVRRPVILAPKGALGEYGGGILGAGVLAVEGAPFGPTAGFEEADPGMSIVPHDGAPLSPARRVALLSAASGGAAAWIVLDRP